MGLEAQMDLIAICHGEQLLAKHGRAKYQLTGLIDSEARR